MVTYGYSMPLFKQLWKQRYDISYIIERLHFEQYGGEVNLKFSLFLRLQYLN